MVEFFYKNDVLYDIAGKTMSGKSLSGADKCREKARNSARRRRTESKSLMEELSNELPFSNEIVSQLDHNSRLRLTLCYMRTKSVLTPDEKKSNQSNVDIIHDYSFMAACSYSFQWIIA